MLAVRTVLLVVLSASAALAQPVPDAANLAAAAARRFPQPVRVGTLLGRTVLQPLESQPVLGRVAQIVRGGDGTLAAVVQYGGLLGIGARPIAVPLDGMALLGADMEVVDFTPAQLDRFATYDASGAAVPLDETIRVGLVKPSH